MENWFKISLLLCVFGFFKEIRPSEPYTYDFLIDKRWRNLTGAEIEKQIYPVGTYSNLILLVLVFLITDLCRYKPLIVVLGLSGITIWAMFIWSTTLFETQILEVFFGVFCATEVAYFTYIYAQVSKEHYQKVTSHTRGAILAGRAISGITSQILVSTGALNYKELNYITFAGVSFATIWALFLPPVPQSLYFHSEINQDKSVSEKILSAFKLMKIHFLEAYTNFHVIKWSAWWALSSCGYAQIDNYMQPLYFAIQSKTAYNGAVQAVLTLFGFLAALQAGYLKINFSVNGELTLGLFSLLQSILILVCSQTNLIYLCYSLYILFGVLFHFMITIASSEIAKQIHDDSNGLIFGINTFASLIFKSILTALFATEGAGFALGIRDQYVAYGSYHLLIALGFIAIGLWTCLRQTNTITTQNSKTLNNDPIKYNAVGQVIEP